MSFTTAISVKQQKNATNINPGQKKKKEELKEKRAIKQTKKRDENPEPMSKLQSNVHARN